MKYFISVKTNAKTVRVDRIGGNELKVAVKEPPTDGKANLGVVNALSGYFGVPKSSISIMTGHKSRKKIVSVK